MEKYSERLGDIAIIQLNTTGFEALSESQKQLAHYLSKAGLYGRFIALDQGSSYNINLMDHMISLSEQLKPEDTLFKQLKDSLFIMFAHNGLYHSMTGERLVLPLVRSELEACELGSAEVVKDIYFDQPIKQFRTVQKDGVDVVAESGGNFYENLTTKEVEEFRQFHYPKSDDAAPFGFNEQLSKDFNDVVSRGIIKEGGLYGQYVSHIIYNLSQALEFTENQEQHKSIATLIDFYRSGSAIDFDKHCVAWVKDQNSHIYYINGLIESYDDPLGIACTFESVVAFKNPEQTKKVEKIIDNIQWFEDHLPFDAQFKKDKAVGLSASSVNVISMAGRTSPTLPLGINLPNSDWIRKKHGSKSVSLSNVSNSRSSYEVQLRDALFLPEYHEVLEKYSNTTGNLHTDLHEIAGHGSGKTLEGVNTDILGIYYAVIEECRADLVALYYMPDEKLKTIGVYDSQTNVADAATAQYVSYLTNGSIGQLRRLNLGKDLTQAHFRNRQLISTWVLEHADSSKIAMVEKDNKHYIKVNDLSHARELFGTLLSKIQAIKSTGDLDAARDLVMTYGTRVNQKVHAEVLERVKMLDMPNTVGFITPMLVQKDNTVVIEQVSNFVEQQIQLHKDFCVRPEKKKTLTK